MFLTKLWQTDSGLRDFCPVVGLVVTAQDCADRLAEKRRLELSGHVLASYSLHRQEQVQTEHVTDVRECGDVVTLMLSVTSSSGELVMVWGGMSFTETFMSSSVVLRVRCCSCRGFHLLSSLSTLYWNITILEFLHVTKKIITIFRFISSI